jgi:hypothetical protein
MPTPKVVPSPIGEEMCTGLPGRGVGVPGGVGIEGDEELPVAVALFELDSLFVPLVQATRMTDRTASTIVPAACLPTAAPITRPA